MAARRHLFWRGLAAILLAFGLLAVTSGGGWLAVRHFRAERHLKAARKAMEEHRLFQARDHLQQVIAYRPRSPEPRFLAARVFRQLDRLEEARQQFDRFQQLQGRSSEETQLEELMLRAQSGDIETVFARLWAYVEPRKPQAGLVLEALSMGFIRNTQLPQAMNCLNRWLTLSPDNPQALFCKAWCFQRRGLLNLSKQWYALALEQDQDRDDIRLRYGQVLRNLNREKEAAQLLSEVVRRRPDYPEAAVSLAACLRGLGKFSEARQLLQAHLEKHPNEAPALAELGAVMLDIGEVAAAEGLLRRALARDPSLLSARFGRVTALRRLGRDKEANAERKTYNRLEKEATRMFTILNHELPKKPRSVALHFEMATLLFRRGQKQPGAQWLFNTLKIDPDHRPSHTLLASYCEEIGEEELARYHRERAGPEPGKGRSHPSPAVRRSTP